MGVKRSDHACEPYYSKVEVCNLEDKSTGFFLCVCV